MIIKLKSVEHMKKIMLVKGFTQRGLSEKSGVSDTHINHIANGNRNPGPVTAKKICEALGCEFEEIFFICDDNKSYQTNSA